MSITGFFPEVFTMTSTRLLIVDDMLQVRQELRHLLELEVISKLPARLLTVEKRLHRPGCSSRM